MLKGVAPVSIKSTPGNTPAKPAYSRHPTLTPVLKQQRRPDTQFSFECFSKEHGEVIHGLFEELPEGVEADPDTKFRTKVDPEAEGVEMYSPAHAYEYRGKGRISGSVRPMIGIYEKAVDEPLIKLGKIEFEFE